MLSGTVLPEVQRFQRPLTIIRLQRLARASYNARNIRKPLKDVVEVAQKMLLETRKASIGSGFRK